MSECMDHVVPFVKQFCKFIVYISVVQLQVRGPHVALFE